jgi:hypothetical protein
MAPVTAVVKTCLEPSVNVTVTVTVIVEPTTPEQPEPTLLLPESVPPGFAFPVSDGPDKPQPPNPPRLTDVADVSIGTSPVFFNTIEKVATPLVGDATSFTWSINAAGLLNPSVKVLGIQASTPIVPTPPAGTVIVELGTNVMPQVVQGIVASVVIFMMLTQVNVTYCLGGTTSMVTGLQFVTL